MKTKKINQSLNNIFEDITPDCFCSIISKIDKEEGAIIKMDSKKEENKIRLPYLKYAMATAFVLLVGVFGVIYYNSNKVFARINFDVNPSVEIMINNHKKVTGVNAKNEDGKAIINDMDLKGSSLDVATNALIGSMLRLGYIDELKNSILLTVEGKDKTASDNLLVELKSEVNELISAYKVDGSVITQTVVTDNELEQLAEKNNISVGKAKLINEIINSNNLYKFEELAQLSINELNLLITSKKNNVTTVNVTGSASDKAYIGKEKATSIALSAANAKNVTRLEVELDLENKIMVYEIEFYYNNQEYDYEINATTGAIIKGGKDIDHDDNNDQDDDDDDDKEPVGTSYIGKTKAKQIALNHAKVSNAREIEVEFEYKAGVAVYEVDFEVGNKDYDYDINATTGKIIKSKVAEDRDNDPIDLDDDDDDDNDDDND